MTDHLGLIQHVVNQLATRYPRHVDRDELWNAGAYGLVDASRRFEPEQGIPFARYAVIRIRGAIIDSTRARDWVPRATRRSLRAVHEATATLQAAHGRSPTDAEVAAHLGIDVARVRELQAANATASVLRLEQALDASDPEATSPLDLLVEEDERVLPELALERREIVGTLRTAVEHLSNTQREVLVRYYFGGEYLREIAGRLGFTEARASQIHSEGLTALRAYLGRFMEGVPAVAPRAPGHRSRDAFLAALDEHTTWRDRLDAADGPVPTVAAVSA